MIRSILIVTAAFALAAAPAPARAQHAHHGTMSHAGDTTKNPAMAHGGAGAAHHAMKSPCPLHMKGLNTTAMQDSVIARVRAAHMADMKQMHGSHGAGSAHAHMADSAMKAQMKSSMGRALDGMRATLDETQRQQLAAAVAAHDAEKAAMAEHGMAHDCAACCREHHAKGEGAGRHEH